MVLATKTSWQRRWTNGDACSKWEKWNINTAIYYRTGMSQFHTMSTQIKLHLNSQIKIELYSVDSYLWHLNSTSTRRGKMDLGVFNIWSARVCRNVSLTKGRNWFPISNWLEEVQVLVLRLIDCSVSCCRLILVVMVQRWKYLLLIRNHSVPFQAGLEQPSCPQWGSSTNGSSPGKSTRKMDSCRWRRGFDDSLSSNMGIMEWGMLIELGIN